MNNELRGLRKYFIESRQKISDIKSRLPEKFI